MTISQVFIDYLESQGYGKFGQTLFLYRVPNSLKTQTDLMWVIPSGGSPVSTNVSGEKQKAYQMLIYYRSNSARQVDEALSLLEEQLNCPNCVELQGFELVSIEATQFAADQDLDSENRMVGMLQVQLTVYKSCVDNVLS